MQTDGPSVCGGGGGGVVGVGIHPDMTPGQQGVLHWQRIKDLSAMKGAVLHVRIRGFKLANLKSIENLPLRGADCLTLLTRKAEAANSQHCRWARAPPPLPRQRCTGEQAS
jgi:hypothetical protein